MTVSFRVWLAEIEESLWRMIHGVYRFTFVRLPEVIVRTLLDTIGPVAVQLLRVLLVLSLWLAVVSVPAIVMSKFGGWGGVLAGVWVALALTGSMWGRAYIVRKRRLTVEAGRSDLPLAKAV